MRKYILLKDDKNPIKKLMIYQLNTDETYLFLYDTEFDKGAVGDFWFETIDEAEKYCINEFNINTNNWIFINDPIAYCQHDMIRPIRTKGRDIGKPIWGEFEILENGIWKEYKDI